MNTAAAHRHSKPLTAVPLQDVCEAMVEIVNLTNYFKNRSLKYHSPQKEGAASPVQTTWEAAKNLLRTDWRYRYRSQQEWGLSKQPCLF